MERVFVTPGDAWLTGRRPFVHLLAEAAAALGGRLELEAAFGHAGWFHTEAGAVRPIFGNALGLNPEAAAMLAADKDYTARLLAAEGIPTPEGRLVFSPAYRSRMALKNRDVAARLPGAREAITSARALGFPLIVKPNSGSEGRGVHRVATQSELGEALDALFVTDDRVRLEACLPGEDLRVTVLDERVRLAYRRIPPAVIGDGIRTVATLLAEWCAERSVAHRGAKLSPDDPRIARTLGEQGLGLEDVVEVGRRIMLLRSANLSAGGSMVSLDAALSAPLAATACKAVRVLGLRWAGVDFLVPPEAPDGRGAPVLEVNAAPGLDYFASAGPAEWEAARLLLMDVLTAPAHGPG
ncbi:MAG: ATP-dependent carboxylate-amine ligase [Pseudomonadota bacterium]